MDVKFSRVYISDIKTLIKHKISFDFPLNINEFLKLS